MGDRNRRPISISSRSAGATSYLRTRAKASPIASIAAASRKLPASLITLARPGSSPATITPWPTASSRGRQRSIASAGPAATIHSCFASAASGRPNTGAATYSCPAPRGGGGRDRRPQRLERVRTTARAVVHDDRVAGLQHVPGDRQSHAAETDDPDVHVEPSFKFPGMKAIRVHTPGGPEALRLDDVPEPRPEPGQAVVKIEAAGVNFIDVYQRTGLYKVALPFTIGQEAAGTVSALGAGVSEPRVGTRVAYCGILGAYAPSAAVPADRLVALPDGVTAADGAYAPRIPQ